MHLPHRQGRQSRVAQYADVQLAPVDVFLDQRIALHVFVNKLHALAKLVHVLDDRRLRNAQRRIFRCRFHEQRKLEFALSRRLEAFAVGKQVKGRRRDAVRGQHLFRQYLVPRQHQAARVGAGVGLAGHLEIRDDVRFVRRDAGKLLQQVEDDVRFPLLHDFAQLGEPVQDAEHADVMAQLAQGRIDVVFAAEHIEFLVAEPVDVFRRNQLRVDHEQYAAAFHRA